MDNYFLTAFYMDSDNAISACNNLYNTCSPIPPIPFGVEAGRGAGTKPFIREAWNKRWAEFRGFADFWIQAKYGT